MRDRTLNDTAFQAAHIHFINPIIKENILFPLFFGAARFSGGALFFANPHKSLFDIPENPIFKNAHKSIVKLYSYFTQKRLTNPDFFP